MNAQVALAIGIVNGQAHTARDAAQLRNVELAQESERRTRRAARTQVRRGR
jgi:hypothetical protein